MPAIVVAAVVGVLFFLGSYAVTNLGAFIVVIAISARTGDDEIAVSGGTVSLGGVTVNTTGVEVNVLP